MRTYIIIGCLAILGNLQYHKVASESDSYLYVDEDGSEGSGDTEDFHLNSSFDSEPHYPLDEETGSGMKPENKGGGGAPDEDAEDDEDDYEYKEEEEVEGSAWYNPSDNDLEIDDPYSDFEISAPELPKEEIYEETSVDSGPSLEGSPERMPSSTPPPTLTDNHPDMDNNNIRILTQKDDERQVSIFAQPGILAAFIGGAVMGLLCAILLVMFIVYRMRKRDEGSYPLDEPKRVPLTSSYSPNDKEIYA